MGANTLTGPGAGSEKYDLLTAMAVAGLSGSPQQLATMMRLIALITARYNWTTNELTVGQREMASMWSVDERTVKREIKRMTQAELLLQKRAGVRGRVAAYRLNITEIYKLSEPVWRRVGPDFAERMDQRVPKTAETVIKVDFQSRPAQLIVEASNPWNRVLNRLESDNAAFVAAWFSKLKFLSKTDTCLSLQAPSRFVAQYVQTHLMIALTNAVSSEFCGAVEVRIGAP